MRPLVRVDAHVAKDVVQLVRLVLVCVDEGNCEGVWLSVVLRRATWLAKVVIKSVIEHISKRILRLPIVLVLLSIVLAYWGFLLLPKILVLLHIILAYWGLLLKVELRAVRAARLELLRYLIVFKQA